MFSPCVRALRMFVCVCVCVCALYGLMCVFVRMCTLHMITNMNIFVCVCVCVFYSADKVKPLTANTSLKGPRYDRLRPLLFYF